VLASEERLPRTRTELGQSAGVRHAAGVRYCKNSVFVEKSGAPGGTRTPDLLVRSKIVQNSKCCIWCRLQSNAPFILLLSWTEIDGVNPKSGFARAPKVPKSRYVSLLIWAGAMSHSAAKPSKNDLHGTGSHVAMQAPARR